MTPANIIMRGLLSTADPADREKIEECAAKIRAVLAEYGDNGIIAIALVGTELEEAQ